MQHQTVGSTGCVTSSLPTCLQSLTFACSNYASHAGSCHTHANSPSQTLANRSRPFHTLRCSALPRAAMVLQSPMLPHFPRPHSQSLSPHPKPVSPTIEGSVSNGTALHCPSTCQHQHTCSHLAALPPHTHTHTTPTVWQQAEGAGGC